MQSGKQTTPEPPKGKLSTTCTACRSRHLRCDGPPACTCCRANGVACVFVESRRGKRTPGPQRATDFSPQTLSPSIGRVGEMSPITARQSGSWTIPQQMPNLFDHPTPQPPNTSLPTPFNSRPFTSSAPSANLAYGESATRDPPHLHLFNLFYQYFNPSHPFLPIREYLTEQLTNGELPHLQAAVSYIGSSYDRALASQRSSLRVAIDFTIFVQHPPRDGFLVQTLLLYAIGLHGNNERSRASQILNMAIDLALEIGLNQKDHAATHNQGSLMLEESWRRTWWELYFIDAIFAAADQKNEFRLSEVPTDCLLPCEEQDYSSGIIPPPQSLSDYEKRSFSIPEFSSYTYRIGTISILAKILPLSADLFAPNHLMDRSDAQIVHWCLALPETKTRPVLSDGSCDQMLIQAYMTIYLAAILLHRPHSSLLTSDPTTGPRFFCAPSMDTHTAKCLHAADNMALLTKVSQSTACFSPIFSHSLVQAATIHLSAWPIFASEQINAFSSVSNIPFAPPSTSRLPAHLTLSPPTPAPIPSRHHISHRIQLQVGTLKSLSQTWPVAASSVEQIKAVSHGVLLQLQQTQMLPSLLGESTVEGLGRFFDQVCQSRDVEENEIMMVDGVPSLQGDGTGFLGTMWRNP